MRIIIDIDQAKDDRKRKAVRVRTKYYTGEKDPVPVHNSGIEIYNAIKDIFDTAFVGGIMEHKGEVK
jgi:hypothetical protein